MKKIAFLIAFTGLFLSSQAFVKPTPSGRPKSPYWSDQQKYLTDTLLARLAQITGNVAVNPTFQAATRSGRPLYPYWFDQTAYLTDTLMKALSQFSGGGGGLQSFTAKLSDDAIAVGLLINGLSQDVINSNNNIMEIGFDTKDANTLLAGSPDSTAGFAAPTFRSLVTSDLPRSLLHYNYADKFNNGSTSLDSFAVRAKTLSQVGTSISAHYAGTVSTAAGSNFFLRFGSQQVAGFSSIAVTGTGSFNITAEISRVSNNKARIITTIVISGTSVQSQTAYFETGVIDFATALNLNLVVSSNITGAIVFKMANVKFNW